MHTFISQTLLATAEARERADSDDSIETAQNENNSPINENTTAETGQVDIVIKNFMISFTLVFADSVT